LRWGLPSNSLFEVETLSLSRGRKVVGSSCAENGTIRPACKLWILYLR